MHPIKGFSTHSVDMEPGHVQHLLNEYFEAMTDIVFRYGGSVDKFLGDGLMVFFGDPEQQDDHALRAVRAAIDMQRKVREIAARWDPEKDMPLAIRIGINTGEVIVGNMGSARRLEYTVLGANVNLAQRLESNAPVGGVLMSGRTYELVGDAEPVMAPIEVEAKGFGRVEAYRVDMDKALTPGRRTTPSDRQ